MLRACRHLATAVNKRKHGHGNVAGAWHLVRTFQRCKVSTGVLLAESSSDIYRYGVCNQENALYVAFSLRSNYDYDYRYIVRYYTLK